MKLLWLMMRVLIEVRFNMKVILYSFAFIVEYLKDVLETFIKDLPIPVRILRNKDRLGLIKSRLRGKYI